MISISYVINIFQGAFSTLVERNKQLAKELKETRNDRTENVMVCLVY